MLMEDTLMKSRLHYLLVLLVFASCFLQAQESFVCGDAFSEMAYTGPTQRGGLYITSQGNIRTLVIFVKFQGDNFNPNSSVWPVNGWPTYLNTFLDPSPSQPTNSGNISHFYRTMSFDRLKIYGDPHVYTTQYPESYYQNLHGNNAYGAANAEALIALNAEINYADYDNWTFGTYGHTQVPDNKVDLIIMFYRKMEWPTNESGVAALGPSFLGSPVLDGKTISFGFPGSGLTNNGGSIGQALYSVKHEIGHYFFGGGHPNHGKNPCSYEDHYGFWGILGSNPHYTITAVDRERLQWIDFHEIGTGTTYASIGDFLTQPGEAYRIQIPGTNEAFILENHQKLLTGAAAIWDDPNHTWPGKGLFIYHVDNVDALTPHYDLLSAEGDFNWSNPYWIPWSGWSYGILPVFRRLSSNRTLGLDGRDFLRHTRPDIRDGCLRVFALEINGQGVVHERLWGDEKDAFNIGYNQVVSPYSNPQAQMENRAPTNIAIEITGKSLGINGEDIFQVTFFNGNPLDASPSKPQDLLGSYYLFDDPYPHMFPQLNWAVMQEPDVINSGKILIYRRSKILSETWSSWSLIDSVEGTETQYIDWGIQSLESQTLTDSVQYRIRGRDNTGKLSGYSDVVTSLIDPRTIEKLSAQQERKPTVYDMHKNYPNPFNPTTVIKYQLPDDGFVVLQVFDILGRVVATLVNEHQEAGYYTATFDGQNISSGVYFTRLAVRDILGSVLFTKTGKVVLAK